MKTVFEIDLKDEMTWEELKELMDFLKEFQAGNNLSLKFRPGFGIITLGRVTAGDDEG